MLARSQEGLMSKRRLLVVLGMLVGACGQAGTDPAIGSDSSGTGAGGDTAVTDTAPGASDAQDAGPKVCVPACEAHQACDDGLCANKTCAADTECNPAGGPPAGDKPHYCYKGKCALFQCGKDEDCAAGLTCNTLTSLCYKKNTGCAVDADCVDSDACTADTCDTKTGKCAHKLAFGCCKTAADCDDGSKCTADACDAKTGKCSYTSVPKCCTDDGNCADNSACTADFCDKATGTCKFTAKTGCCDDKGQCDDDLDATDDACVAGKCVHAMAGMPTACQTAVECQATACVTAQCVAGKCSFAKQAGATGCCVDAGSCTTDKACHLNKCTGLVCMTPAAGAIGTHVWQRFDDNKLNGWLVSKDNKTAFFHFNAGHQVSGGGALRYGVPGKQTWSGGFPNKGSITSGDIAIPKGSPKVGFYVWFDGEPASGVHLFGLKVVAAGKETDVWSKNADLKGNTGGAWKLATADLAGFAGKTVKLKFWFDVAADFPKEDGHGLVIDELELLGGCP